MGPGEGLREAERGPCVLMSSILCIFLFLRSRVPPRRRLEQAIWVTVPRELAEAESQGKPSVGGAAVGGSVARGIRQRGCV